MPSTAARRTLVKVEVNDAEKRRVPSKHYSYVIKVWWNDGSETQIYRRYSKFFEFQIILLETFPYEGGLKEPSARIIPFLPGKILFRRSHVRDVAMKRLKPIDEYCKALIKLPGHISKCNHVLDFFETRPEDLNPTREDGSRRRKREDQANRSLSLTRSLRGVRRSQSLSKEIGEISGPLLLEQYIAIADYTSTQQKELTMAVGQKVEVIEKNENGWWFVSNDEGERGWVPGVYLEKPDGTVEDLVTKRAEPGQGEHYVTSQAYTAENSDDISFGAGVIVEVLQKNLEGWWLVSYNGKQGNAPASYLEKSHNWVQENNKVEIISSIHDLKHRHSLPANDLSSIAFPSQRIMNYSISTKPIPADVHSIPEEPKSPVSPTYIKEKTVQPPPKRSSVKRTNKRRPNLPPPLPPSGGDEPTYEYTTVAPFDSTIPDGVSFGEDKKVEVLEKSPGGWWYINIDGSEGWAPASYIEKRETKQKTVVPPSRPTGPPKLLKNNSTNSFSITAAGTTSPVHKVPSTNTVSHPVLGKVASIPILRNQSSMSPAKRPLPPLPTSMSSSNVQDSSDTYEEVGITRPLSENIKFEVSHSVPPAVPKSAVKPIPSKPIQKVDSTPVDFRSVLKSSIASKQNELKTRSAQSPPRPSTNPIPPSNANKPKLQLNSVKTLPKTANATQKPTNVRKSITRMNSNESSTSAAAPKPTRPAKIVDGPPRLPPKPKPSMNSVKAKPVLRNVPSSDDGAITDFRSVLRSTQRKQSESSNGVGRSKSFNADKIISTKSDEQQNKPPYVPKKPANMALRPPVPSKMKGLDEVPDGEENNLKVSTKKTVTRPPWNAGPGTKPVLRRFQTNNNSNVDEVQKKPVFTVGHLKIELKNPPDLSSTLPKRGSPDGQVDAKFEDNTKKTKMVVPPARTKKVLKPKSNNTKILPKVDKKEETTDGLHDVCIALSDYAGLEECEISFKCGDEAELLEKGENDWWYVKIGDNAGWAPSSFFKLSSDSVTVTDKSYVDVNNSSVINDHDTVYSEIEGERPRFPAKFIAIADFNADDHSMVNLSVGDEVTITQEAAGGWWYAILTNGSGEGWVPSSYLDPSSY